MHLGAATWGCTTSLCPGLAACPFTSARCKSLVTGGHAAKGAAQPVQCATTWLPQAACRHCFCGSPHTGTEQLTSAGAC